MMAAIFAIVSFAGVVLAADRVDVKVVSEPIQSKATCDKAGSFSFKFDAGTILVHGMQFTIDLDVGATLCNDIDMVIAPNAGANPLTGALHADYVGPIGWTEVTTPLDDTAVTSPVVYTEESDPLGGNDFTTSANGGVFFHVYGAAKTQRVTLDIVGVDGIGTLRIGSDPDDSLTLTFFHQGTQDMWVRTSAMKKLDQDLNSSWYYEEQAEVVDNTYCINVSAYEDNKVQSNIDSLGDIFTVIPSNPQVAHIMSALDVGLFECKERRVGNIDIGETDQTGCIFDNESGTGYCTENYNNHMIIESKNGTFDNRHLYVVGLGIFVNGKDGDNGVYFTGSQDLRIALYDDDFNRNACGSDLGATSDVGTTFLMADKDLDEPAKPTSTCTFDPEDDRSVFVTSGALSFPGDIQYIQIDIPTLKFDRARIKEGDVVSIGVQLVKPPCGSIYSGLMTIGTFGCGASYRSLLYPYFGVPAAAGGYFYNGLAVTNIGKSAGNLSFFLYEQDGDIFRYDVAEPVAAHSIYQTTISQLVETGTPVTVANSSGDGVAGNAKCYVVACTGFLSDGFALLGNTATGESLGYLPRYENQEGPASSSGLTNDYSRYQAVCETLTMAP